MLIRKGVIKVLATKPQISAETSDTAKLELYRLVGEGYKAMQEGRTSLWLILHQILTL